jgi:hypothetical protein
MIYHILFKNTLVIITYTLNYYNLLYDIVNYYTLNYYMLFYLKVS